jgi:hypothetical protein
MENLTPMRSSSNSLAMKKGKQLWRDAPDHIEARAWGEQPNTCEKHCEIGQLVQVMALAMQGQEEDGVFHL